MRQGRTVGIHEHCETVGFLSGRTSYTPGSYTIALLKGRRKNDITNQIHGRLMAKKAGFVDG